MICSLHPFLIHYAFISHFFPPLLVGKNRIVSLIEVFIVWILLTAPLWCHLTCPAASHISCKLLENPEAWPDSAMQEAVAGERPPVGAQNGSKCRIDRWVQRLCGSNESLCGGPWTQFRGCHLVSSLWLAAFITAWGPCGILGKRMVRDKEERIAQFMDLFKGGSLWSMNWVINPFIHSMGKGSNFQPVCCKNF